MQAGGKRGGDPADLDDGGVIEPEELAFAQEDERLPWLEADDDVDEGAVDTGRVVAFVVGSLVVLALVIGALWWIFRDSSGGDLVADGSTIEAPAGPYKTKPENPGGAEALGTGDTSFAVAQGRTIEGKIAVSPAPQPSIDRNQAGSGPEAASAAKAEASPAEGVGVQVGAYSSRDRAEAGWSTLSTRYPALDGVKHRIVQGTVDGSPIFRLQAVAGDVKTASQLCSALQSQGGDCQVKN
jgi:hypothetical protein